MTERFRVVGGARLRGEVEVVGAKNSVLKLMALALLAEGRTTLTNVPAIADVAIMAELLRRLGVDVEEDLVSGVIVLDVPDQLGHQADDELVRALRASICVLGPLVARVGHAGVAIPGGDAIGARGLDLHSAGLEALGARVHITRGYLVADAPRGLTGAPTSASSSPASGPPRTSSRRRPPHRGAPSSRTSLASRRSPTSSPCSARWALRSPGWGHRASSLTESRHYGRRPTG